jgi:hypothetical protein
MSDASASESHDDDPQTTGSDPRYASQAAAAEPAPVALEGGASEPGGGGGGTTGRSEWLFLVLAVFFTLALVSIPAVFFTSIDLTATAEVSGGGGVSDGSEGALERERLQLLQETRSAALAKLSAYGPVDDAGGNGDRAYRIPLDRAMRLTLRDEYAAAAASGASATFPAGGRGLKVVVPGDAPAPDAPAPDAPASDSSARR